jgi:alpha-beta hydrolase superfamily lysophospholipase
MDQGAFEDADGVEVAYRRVVPAVPRGIVLVLHGASEHGGRYDRFARELAEHSWAAYAPDHRGHGRTALSSGRGRMGPGGAEGLLRDVDQLRGLAVEEVGDVPVVVFGHSMGSLIAIGYIERSGTGLAGCILSGNGGIADGLADLATMVRQVAEGGMADEVMDALSPFNEPFEPARTPYDWLSRDPAEVDAYIADPDCGDQLPLTYGFLAEIMELGARSTTPEGLGTIPAALPLLLVTGDQDPVSNDAANVRVLEQALRDRGLPVTAHYYEGARHEVLNETNRAEVQTDIVRWLDGLPSA